MRTECLPLHSIPHITPLFKDFVSDFSRVSAFYAATSNVPTSGPASYTAEIRQAVAGVLDRQNRGWEASAATIMNIDRLRNGASAIVTGQQVALFGGPMFAILKALTAVKEADVSARSGTDCVPIFWLASEDHDLLEVSGATVLDESGAPRHFSVAVDAAPGVPVGGIRFDSHITALAEEAAQTFGDAEIAALLRDCYKAGETFTGAFARLFAKLFADFGLILLDPSDAALHEIAKPLLKSAVENSAELNTKLLERGKELAAGGYHAQVKVTASSTVLFALQEGIRTAVHRSNGSFTIGKEKLTAAELASRVNAKPAEFSANALFRPVMQDYLLPTLAYVGGPAEVAYFAQSQVVYQELLGRVTPILPRISATVVDARVERLLKRYELTVPKSFVPAEELQQKIASRALPPEVTARFEAARSEMDKQLVSLGEELKNLDATLQDAAKHAGSKMRYQLSRLKTRAEKAEAHKNGQITQDSAVISNAMFPRKDLQERGIAGISFVGRNGTVLLRQIFDAIDLDCPGHQLFYL